MKEHEFNNEKSNETYSNTDQKESPSDYDETAEYQYAGDDNDFVNNGYDFASFSSPRKNDYKSTLLIVLICSAIFIVLFGLGFLGMLSLTEGSFDFDKTSNDTLFNSGFSDLSDVESIKPEYGTSTEHQGYMSYAGHELEYNSHHADIEIHKQEGVRVYRKASPSVVGVIAYSEQNDRSKKLASIGSGIIVNSEGFILTNQHIIDGYSYIEVTVYDGGNLEIGSYIAEIVGQDIVSDIALLKITADNLIPADFCDSDDVCVGETVYAIGNPGGLKFNSSISCGLVSGKNRILNDMYLIQTDVAVNPGSSGGALVNAFGQVIGITSEKLVTISGINADGIAFAIPSNTAIDIAKKLMKYGSIAKTS